MQELVKEAKHKVKPLPIKILTDEEMSEIMNKIDDIKDDKQVTIRNTADRELLDHYDINLEHLRKV